MAIVPFDRSVLKVNQAILMGVIVVGYLVGLAITRSPGSSRSSR